MTTRLPRVLTLLACLTFLPLLTACGKGSPTGPDAAETPEPQTELVTFVSFDFLVAHNDGDLIGDGEFEFRRGVNGNMTFTSVKLGDGDAWDIEGSSTRVEGEGSEIKVYFEASELDTDLLGRDIRDGDMDKRSKTNTHTVAENLNGQYSIMLGNDDCKVQVYYTLKTVRG
jgi:hypothetical protein